MTALPGETPGTGGTDTPQDAVSPPDEAGAERPAADAGAAGDGAEAPDSPSDADEAADLASDGAGT
ncbi:hypothetical protein ACFXNY_28055, partial [Streptomyces sindenensis]